MKASFPLRIAAGVLAITLTIAPGITAVRAAVPAPETRGSLEGIDAFITALMSEFQVPGLAIGVIADGKVILSKAYGKRDVERNLPATTNTVMAVGSVTKSFTALLLAMLVEETKLAWDRPVRDYMPDFRLADDYATANMTVRDLLTHASGLPSHDRVWKGRSFTRQQLFERLRYLEPNTTFRQRFQYQNLMVVTAGLLAERITGKTWDALIRERLFIPLGMTRSSTSITEIVKADDFAQPYMPLDGKAIREPFLNIDAVGPAGAINSSVEDMLKYVQFRLDLGAVNGRQLVPRAAAQLMETAQIAMPTPADTDEIDFAAYGFGLAIESYKGHRMVHHSGGIDGFIAEMGWMPKQRIGLVILTNRTANPLAQIIHRQVYDQLLRLPPTDWAARWRKTVEQAVARNAATRLRLDKERIRNAPPTHALAAYAGEYDHPGYGRMTVKHNAGILEIHFDKFVVRLKPYHYDVFEVNIDGEIPNLVPVRGLVKFHTGAGGRIDTLSIPFETAVPDILFTRQ